MDDGRQFMKSPLQKQLPVLCSKHWKNSKSEQGYSLRHWQLAQRWRGSQQHIQNVYNVSGEANKICPCLLFECPFVIFIWTPAWY